MRKRSQRRESVHALHHQHEEKERSEHRPDDGACGVVERGHDDDEDLESQDFSGPLKREDLREKVVGEEHAKNHAVALEEDVGGVGENERGGPAERGEGEGGSDEVGEVESEAEGADGLGECGGWCGGYRVCSRVGRCSHSRVSCNHLIRNHLIRNHLIRNHLIRNHLIIKHLSLTIHTSLTMHNHKQTTSRQQTQHFPQTKEGKRAIHPDKQQTKRKRTPLSLT